MPNPFRKPEIVRDLIPRNFKPGRKSPYPIDAIWIHVMEGTMIGTHQHFRDPEAVASAHYGIGRDGSIEQYVDEADTAWHAGRVSDPTAPLVIERLPANPNGYSIGIEHEGSGKDEMTPEQRESSAWLIWDIHERRGVPIDRRHIIGHHESYRPKSCPGKIDVGALVAFVKAGGFTPAPVIVAEGGAPGAPRVVWSPSLRDYLIVTNVVSDAEWYFVPWKSVRDWPAGQRKAGSNLSEMPRGPK